MLLTDYAIMSAVLTFLVGGASTSGGEPAATAASAHQVTAQLWVVKKRADVIPAGDPRGGHVEDYLATHAVLLRSPLSQGGRRRPCRWTGRACADADVSAARRAGRVRPRPIPGADLDDRRLGLEATMEA
jgi:hypothetical protein